MSTQRRRVLENVGITDGVYIEGLNGRVYTVDDWQGGSAANSIIVASGDVKFRIALTQSSQAMDLNWYTHDTGYTANMTGITGKTEALSDYDGAENTAKMLLVEPSTKYAAGYCNAFTFPDGKTMGYLPSLGQLDIAHQNKTDVDATLSACGGTALSSSYWSSTLWGYWNSRSTHFWYINWDVDDDNDYYVYSKQLNFGVANKLYVRPFADLE